MIEEKAVPASVSFSTASSSIQGAHSSIRPFPSPNHTHAPDQAVAISFAEQVDEGEAPFVMGGPNGTVMKIYGELQQVHAAQRNLDSRLHEWMESEKEFLRSIQEEFRTSHPFRRTTFNRRSTHHSCVPRENHHLSCHWPSVEASGEKVNAATVPKVSFAAEKDNWREAPPQQHSLRMTAKSDQPYARGEPTTTLKNLKSSMSRISLAVESTPLRGIVKSLNNEGESSTRHCVVSNRSIPVRMRSMQKVHTFLGSFGEDPDNCLVPYVRSPLFDNFWAVVIALNALLIAIHVEQRSTLRISNSDDARQFEMETSRPFDIAGRIFTFLFLVELLLRIGALRSVFFLCPRDRWWNWFDLVLVTGSMAELLLELFFSVGSVGGSQGRMWRLLKMQRVMRLVRMFRFCQRLRVMLVLILESAKSLMWVLILLCLILFTVAICFAEGTIHYLQSDEKENLVYYEDIDYFWGSVSKCIYSLYIAMSNGISWHQLAKPLFHVSPWLGACFLLYVSFAILALMNIVTGVFVDGAMQQAMGERDMVIESELIGKRKVMENLREIFYEADQDDSGTLTKDEFCSKFRDERVQAYMATLHIHYGDPESLFQSLDTDRDGQLDIDEFILKIFDLKGMAAGKHAVDIKFLIAQNRQMLRATTGLLDWLMSQAPVFQKAASTPAHAAEPVATKDRHSEQGAEGSAPSITEVCSVSCQLPSKFAL